MRSSFYIFSFISVGIREVGGEKGREEEKMREQETEGEQEKRYLD